MDNYRFTKNEDGANWVKYAVRLQSISQNGLTFNDNHYDIQRYKEIRDIAAEMMAMSGGAQNEQLIEIFSREQGYATPKVDVRGIVFRGDQILMCREAADGCWTVPGGWADPGESPRQSVEREVWEESGFRVKATRLLAVYDRSLHPHRVAYPFHIYKLFFLCDLIGGEATISPETTAVDFFDRENLPELSIGRVTPWQLERMFEHREHPDWPADFD